MCVIVQRAYAGSLDDEDYLRIIIDDTPPDLRERNELIKALENARRNGFQIKDEDIEKLIKMGLSTIIGD